MSLLKGKSNNSGIKQLNQIENEINNNLSNTKVNTKPNSENNIQNNKEIISEENEDDEEEEEEEEENENLNEEELNDDNSGENENEEEEEDDNLSILESYKCKLDYFDNHRLYPRPKTNFIFYKNSDNTNNFISNPNNTDNIPSVRAYFKNIEEFNSSIKLIRPSQYIIPYNYNNLIKSLNLFGINVEPFSIDENQNNIEFIQKINVQIKNNYNRKILRCQYCQSIYNKINFNTEVMTNYGSYQTNKLHCFICKNISNFYTVDSFSNNNCEKEINPDKIFFIPKIENNNKPSIEYILNEENENNNNNITNFILRNTIQIIILDLSNKNFIDSIYKILIKILNQKEMSEDIKYKIKYILIAYDINKVYFIYFNNKIDRTINITIMNDLKDAFCPIDPKRIIYNKNDFIELLDSFYNSFILNKNKTKNSEENSFNIYSINNSIIKSIFNLIKINKINENINKTIINYYHLIFLSSFHHNIDTNILVQNKIYKIFLSFFLILKVTNKNIPFINNLKTTNAKLYFYPIEYDDPSDIEQKYEKLNNDLNFLLSNYKNYIYEIKMNICYDKSLFQNYFNDDYIYISFIPNINQFNKLYILPQIKKPNLKESVYIQFNIEYYYLFDSSKHIRILNFFNKISNNEIEIFKSYDEEVLFRTILAYHISKLNLDTNNFASINKLFIDISNKKESLFLKVIKDIKNRIKMNLAKNYRFGEEINNIYRPISCKNFSLYFYSFVKQISNGDNLHLFNLLYDSPITIFMKNIYPNLFRLGYKLKKKEETINLRPLSMIYLERNQLLLIDDGLYITILINNEINKRKKEHFFKKFDEKNKKYEFFVEPSSILINIINNKPMKIIFLDDETILNKKILKIFLEDKIIKNINVEDEPIKPTDNINEYIQNDISYPNYYEILTGNLYEFLE